MDLILVLFGNAVFDSSFHVCSPPTFATQVPLTHSLTLSVVNLLGISFPFRSCGCRNLGFFSFFVSGEAPSMLPSATALPFCRFELLLLLLLLLAGSLVRKMALLWMSKVRSCSKKPVRQTARHEGGGEVHGAERGGSGRGGQGQQQGLPRKRISDVYGPRNVDRARR